MEWIASAAVSGVLGNLIGFLAFALMGYLLHRFYVLDRVRVFLRMRLGAISSILALVPEAIEQVNMLADEFEISEVRAAKLPKVVSKNTPPVDHWAADDALRKRASELRASKFYPPGGENRPHGIFLDTLSELTGTDQVNSLTVDYALITASREFCHQPQILSSGAVIFCPSEKKILLQKRSPQVHTYPGAFHILGGNYEPATAVNNNDELRSDGVFGLERTMAREVFEESGIRIKSGTRQLFTISKETTTGFVQFVSLGMTVQSTDITSSIGTPQEGGVNFYSFSELTEMAEKSKLKFVPSGLAILILWLKLGAPDCFGNCPCRIQASLLCDALINNYDDLISKKILT